MRHTGSRPGRKYAAIPNSAMRNDTISIAARGMLALLMTYSDTWVFHKDQIMKTACVGKDKFTNIMNELDKSGYVKKELLRGKDGRLTGTRWVITDDPFHREPENATLGETESVENREPENPTSGEPAPIRRPTEQEDQQASKKDTIVSSKALSKPDYEIAFNEWNIFAQQHSLSKAKKLTKPRIAKINARLKDCGGLEGWVLALEKISQSQFLLGANDSGWSANLDFVLQESSFTKLTEGTYRSKTNGTTRPQNESMLGAVDRRIKEIQDGRRNSYSDQTSFGDIPQIIHKR